MPKQTALLVSTYRPRHDGLATFTGDLGQALLSTGNIQYQVLAIDPEDEAIPYGREVIGRMQQGDRDSYLGAAKTIQRARPDIVCVQHEFGLWGEWDEDLVDDYSVPFVRALAEELPATPLICTLHTIRPSPPDREREVLARLVEHTKATVVMARTGAMILMDDYGVARDKIVSIPHGVPVVEQRPRRYFKRRLGVEGRTIICTLGMLDRRKGIEYAIAAMPSVVKQHPDALYLIVGETHPEVRKRTGEGYRNELRRLVRDLGMTSHVRFVNTYLSDRELIDYLQASDIYLTPYLDRMQITSGTLAFAVGTGRAIVSTPYPHATEALAEGRGLLAEFRSADSISRCLLRFLDDPEYRRDAERRTGEYGQDTAWPLVGQRYAELFNRVVREEPLGDLLAVETQPVLSA